MVAELAAQENLLVEEGGKHSEERLGPPCVMVWVMADMLVAKIMMKMTAVCMVSQINGMVTLGKRCQRIHSRSWPLRST